MGRILENKCGVLSSPTQEVRELQRNMKEWVVNQAAAFPLQVGQVVIQKYFQKGGYFSPTSVLPSEGDINNQ